MRIEPRQFGSVILFIRSVFIRSLFIRSKFIRSLFIRSFFIQLQNLYGHFLYGQILYGSKFIRFKIYTGQNSYGQNLYSLRAGGSRGKNQIYAAPAKTLNKDIPVHLGRSWSRQSRSQYGSGSDGSLPHCPATLLLQTLSVLLLARNS
jgi:hypothetical protein